LIPSASSAVCTCSCGAQTSNPYIETNGSEVFCDHCHQKAIVIIGAPIISCVCGNGINPSGSPVISPSAVQKYCSSTPSSESNLRQKFDLQYGRSGGPAVNRGGYRRKVPAV
jgi:hypothetical protein